MFARACFIVAASCLLWTSGCFQGEAEQPAVVLAVSASYPGANASTIANTMATVIEHQLNGTAGLVRIESESRLGSYVAHLRFKPNTDPQAAKKLVEARLAIAEPQLPGIARANGLFVKQDDAKDDASKVTIALIDRQGQGWQAMQSWADAVSKRLVKDQIASKVSVFPLDEKQIAVDINREKCVEYAVKPAKLLEAINKNGEKTIETLKMTVVVSERGEKIPLMKLASWEEVMVPAAVYRVNLKPAIRLVGAVPAGMSPVEAAAHWISAAQAELRDQPNTVGVAVQALLAK